MTKYQDVSHEQLNLRVKFGSELDLALKALLQADRPMNEDDLRGIGGKARTPWLVRQLDQWFDNVRISGEKGDPKKSVRFSYVNVMPAVPVAVGTDVANVLPSNAQEDVEPIRWPQAPPLINTWDGFRKPRFYDTMEKMVGLGKHISLAGPPGVGKDTAVQQLAAEQGMPMVTIGGDAGFRKRDLVGTVHIANGRSFLEVSEYAAAVVNGWWVLLTEVNAADPDAILFINAQLAAPYVISVGGKTYPVHPNFRLFITYNPGLIGTKPLPQSFKDRFFSIQIPFPTEASLRSILEANGLPEEASYAYDLVRFGRAMWEAHERGQMRYQVTTRRLIDAVALVENRIADDWREAVKMSVIEAIDSPVEQRAAQNVLGGI